MPGYFSKLDARRGEDDMAASIDTFLTDRLSAERITAGHFEDIRRLHRDPDVMKTLSADGRPLPDEVTRQ
jgi:hypothetical protein